ncbi:MAG TPA: hypothetical protein VFG76_07940, partial [Candidatus Polarisedimenticolia bacterium]|nr:hypothetical protein [Candidatus Polarisedimenticolia bacterium]
AAAASTSQAQAVAVFEGRVKEYLALHNKLEATLPGLPKDATPEKIDEHQRALGALIKSARANAKPGDLFAPGIQALVKKVLAEVMAGADGKTIKASIMDENPGVPKLAVNDRYPSSIPLTTMPPQVLQPLPKLPKELEYRFIGSRLIVMDIGADIILDFTEDVVPK